MYSGNLKSDVESNPSLIALGNDYPYVSMDGNEVVVEESEGVKYVFFYTFRGVLDNYSGFLYVPRGGDPAKFSDLNEASNSEIKKLKANWFYVSHH